MHINSKDSRLILYLLGCICRSAPLVDIVTSVTKGIIQACTLVQFSDQHYRLSS